MTQKIKVKQRVAKPDGKIGIVEQAELGFCTVRWLTPDNKPSLSFTICYEEDLIPVPESVVPMKRTSKFLKEQNELYNFASDISKDIVDFEQLNCLYCNKLTPITEMGADYHTSATDYNDDSIICAKCIIWLNDH